MGKRMKHYYLMNNFSKSKKSELNCEQEQEELERFETSDLAPIEASESFKKELKEKLWDLIKNKYYLFFALAVFLFS